jgi:hypothetical protein
MPLRKQRRPVSSVAMLQLSFPMLQPGSCQGGSAAGGWPRHPPFAQRFTPGMCTLPVFVCAWRGNVATTGLVGVGPEVPWQCVPFRPLLICASQADSRN